MTDTRENVWRGEACHWGAQGQGGGWQAVEDVVWCRMA